MAGLRPKYFRGFSPRFLRTFLDDIIVHVNVTSVDHVNRPTMLPTVEIMGDARMSWNRIGGFSAHD